MNYCTHCGNHLKPGARFCSKCGQVIQGHHPADMSQKSVQPSCPVCRYPVTPGSRFCKSCGASLSKATQVAGNPRPSASSAPEPPVPGKRKRKWVPVLITLLFMLPAVGAVFYFLGTFEIEPQKATLPVEQVSITESMADKLNEYAVSGIEDIAKSAEQVFLQADTAGLARILAPTTLERQRAHFADLLPHMKAFGEDFRNRKVLYANELYAVYEFECSRGKFTVDFCLGEDGTWKLMRF